MFPQTLHSTIGGDFEESGSTGHLLCGTKFSRLACGHSRDGCQQYLMHRESRDGSPTGVPLVTARRSRPVPCRRDVMTCPMTTCSEVLADVSLPEYLDRSRRRVDDALAAYLPEADASAGAACPLRLAAAMRYSVLGGGKRLRPVLCLMAAEACGGDPDAAMPAACALELVHTYSLIHDDLPAMDDDDLRRGRPTCHKAFDEATAILAGDALLTLAFELVAREIEPAAAALGCVRILAEAAGPAGMVGGQMADLQAEQQALDERNAGSLAELEAIHRRKTGALLRAPLADGGGDRPGPRGAPPGARPLRAGRRPGLPDRRRPARRAGGRDQAGQTRGQGFRAGQMDVPQVPGRRRQPPPGPATRRRGRGGARAPGPPRPSGSASLALALLERDR